MTRNRYLMAAAVLVLLVLVGGAFLLIGITNNTDPGDGSTPQQHGAARVGVASGDVRI